jgi:hypothetical protein
MTYSSCRCAAAFLLHMACLGSHNSPQGLIFVWLIDKDIIG